MKRKLLITATIETTVRQAVIKDDLEAYLSDMWQAPVNIKVVSKLMPLRVGTTFNAADVLTLVPSWTEEKAEEWLQKQGHPLQDYLTEKGWDALRFYLDLEGVVCIEEEYEP